MTNCGFQKNCFIVFNDKCEKQILSFLRPVFSENLTWRSLEGLAELANLTVYIECSTVEPYQYGSLPRSGTRKMLSVK